MSQQTDVLSIETSDVDEPAGGPRGDGGMSVPSAEEIMRNPGRGRGRIPDISSFPSTSRGPPPGFSPLQRPDPPADVIAALRLQAAEEKREKKRRARETEALREELTTRYNRDTAALREEVNKRAAEAEELREQAALKAAAEVSLTAEVSALRERNTELLMKLGQEAARRKYLASLTGDNICNAIAATLLATHTDIVRDTTFMAGFETECRARCRAIVGEGMSMAASALLQREIDQVAPSIRQVVERSVLLTITSVLQYCFVSSQLFY